MYYTSHDGRQRTRLIGRERGYHGVGFGGISVGGIAPNRKAFSGGLLPAVDHLPHTLTIKAAAFSKGQPAWGAHLADDCRGDRRAGGRVDGGLIPPQGYLQRLREICDRHDILLIFDEVITGWGRLGAPFAAQYFASRPTC